MAKKILQLTKEVEQDIKKVIWLSAQQISHDDTLSVTEKREIRAYLQRAQKVKSALIGVLMQAGWILDK